MEAFHAIPKRQLIYDALQCKHNEVIQKIAGRLPKNAKDETLKASTRTM